MEFQPRQGKGPLQALLRWPSFPRRMRQAGLHVASSARATGKLSPNKIPQEPEKITCQLPNGYEPRVSERLTVSLKGLLRGGLEECKQIAAILSHLRCLFKDFELSDDATTFN